MSIVRLLVRGGILALFGIAAVVAMTFLFSAQIRFDQAAELQIRGRATPRAAPTIISAGHGLFAETGEAHASPSDNLSFRGEEVSREATASIKPLVYLPERSLPGGNMPDPPEPRAQAAVIEAGPAPKADSRFATVRVNRPGAEPTVYRVPKER
jgi:hypothetical protein